MRCLMMGFFDKLIQYYYDVLNICKCCQQEKHVVFSIKPLSRWKLLKGHSPRYSRK